MREEARKEEDPPAKDDNMADVGRGFHQREQIIEADRGLEGDEG